MTSAHPAALVCAAGCGIPLHPAAAAGGYSTHPGCDPAARPPDGPRQWRWACLACGIPGHADGPGHARALLWIHERFACPAFATSYADPHDADLARVAASGRLPATPPPDGYLARMARRAEMHRLFPDTVPAYTEPFRAPGQHGDDLDLAA